MMLETRGLGRAFGALQAVADVSLQVQPGELSCDPATALGRLGTSPPH